MKYICLRCLKKEPSVKVTDVEKIIIECSYCNGVENWCHTVASKRKKVVKLTQEQADDIAKIPKSKRVSSEEWSTKAAEVTEDTVDPEAQAEAVEAQSVTAEEPEDKFEASKESMQSEIDALRKQEAERIKTDEEESIESLKAKIAKLEGKE